jgi:hypothetical protein
MMQLTAVPLAKEIQPGPFMLAITDQKKDKDTRGSTFSGASSLRARNALEKHYFKGIGIQVAPHLDGMRNFFSTGIGGYSLRTGVAANWQLSPRISVETALDYSTTNVRLSALNAPPSAGDPQFGNLDACIVTNKLLSLPVSLRYRQWIGHRSQFLVGAGFRPYALVSRQFLYNYVKSDITPDGDTDRISTLETRNETRFYGGALSTSAGVLITREKNKGSWEASLFYERGVSGEMKNNQLQLLGIRTAYWFKVR